MFQDFIDIDTSKNIHSEITSQYEDTITKYKAKGIKTEHILSKGFDDVIFKTLEAKIKDINAHYNTKIQSISQPTYSLFNSEKKPDSGYGCDSCKYENNTWMKYRKWDFTCFLFLSQCRNVGTNFDEYSFYGGKIDFPQHKFGFEAELGTLVIVPSIPNFVYKINPAVAGDFVLCKIHLHSTDMFVYDPTEFPGDYISWFETLDVSV